MDTHHLPTVKYKIICRIQDGRYLEELRRNDLPRTAPFSEEELHALKLLHCFSPERRTRELCSGMPDAVFVFRTDAVQIAEFEALLDTSALPDENPAIS